MNEKKYLVTGAAGFIGFFLAKRLAEEGATVIGVDNLNDYYDVSLKISRLKLLEKYKNFSFKKVDCKNSEAIANIFKIGKFDAVIHLAAQAGVRYSLENPHAYIDSNICGFLNILEACRHSDIAHLVYASSSSVYGGNKTMPFSTQNDVSHPVSLYAATKKANELMAHTYSHLYKIPTTGLRFFTVYGPWGRPDMAYFLFAKAILENKPIKIFNHGKMERDFTYIDDIVDGICRVIIKPPIGSDINNWDEQTSKNSSFAPYKIYNIGNNKPVKLEYFISVLEEKLGGKAEKVYLEMQPGDIEKTYADIQDFQIDTGYSPTTSIETGLEKFVDWYKNYYKV